MNGFQNYIILGNLGGDPEMRYLQDGTAVTNFSVAVNEKRGESETTTWVRVTTWNKLAEICNQYLSKGRAVLVQGSRMKASAYLDKQGAPHASLELTASTVQFLGSGNGNGGGGESEKGSADGVPF
jgi:single-strand DNA-binding protein